MFRKPTVFILGAGASWHYGYPTGEDLVRLTRERSIILKSYFENSMSQPVGFMPNYVLEKHDSLIDLAPANAPTQAWALAAKDCEDFARRVQNVDPLVIDYFLGHNKDMQSLGRLLITWVLKEREAKFNELGRNVNRGDDEFINLDKLPKDNWLRFILHRLTVGRKQHEGLLDNAVTFVTFNYDLSLEDQIARGLRSNSSLSPADVREFMDNRRFTHVYGKIRDDGENWARISSLFMPNGKVDPSFGKSFFDELSRLSNGIRTIDPDEKDSSAELTLAKDKIREAQCIYILGFGFDQNNCARIGIEPGNFQAAPRAQTKSILFTNYCDSNRVNKAASRAFFGYANAFQHEPIVDQKPNRGNYYEKSIRDCYGALALDFDEVEEH